MRRPTRSNEFFRSIPSPGHPGEGLGEGSAGSFRSSRITRALAPALSRSSGTGGKEPVAVGSTFCKETTQVFQPIPLKRVCRFIFFLIFGVLLALPARA